MLDPNRVAGFLSLGEPPKILTFEAESLLRPASDTSVLFPMDAPESWLPSRAGFQVATKRAKTPSFGALPHREKRGELLHVFLHHEIQAAELFAWASIRYPNMPESFHRGLFRIVSDELRHARMYEALLRNDGYTYGDFPIRDWFWERTPNCNTPLEFVSMMGIGFEGGNLDHCERYVSAFAALGMNEIAETLAVVGREEEAHVRFGLHWYQELEGKLEFQRYREVLPPPLSPMVMKGRPMAKARRLAVGFTEEFLEELEAFNPSLHPTPHPVR